MLPERVVTDRLLSDAQLESVVLAGEAHAGHLAAHYRIGSGWETVRRCDDGAVQERVRLVRPATLILANGWRLARPRIMGADRIEIEGPDDTDTATLRRMGCTVESVSWRARAFAPGAQVLDRILERWPLAA